MKRETWLEVIAVRKSGEGLLVKVVIAKDHSGGTAIFRVVFKEVAGKF